MGALLIVAVPLPARRRKLLHANLKQRGMALQAWAAPLVGRKYGIFCHVTERRTSRGWELVAVYAWPPIQGLPEFLALAARNASLRPKRRLQLELDFDQTTNDGTKENTEHNDLLARQTEGPGIRLHDTDRPDPRGNGARS